MKRITMAQWMNLHWNGFVNQHRFRLSICVKNLESYSSGSYSRVAGVRQNTGRFGNFQNSLLIGLCMIFAAFNQGTVLL